METLIQKIRQRGIRWIFKSISSRTLLYSKIIYIEYRVVMAKLFSKAQFILRDVQGSKMLLDLRDKGISRELYFTGVHESVSTEQLRKELTEGMTVLEIGANIGYYTLVESQIIGQSGRILAFEPSPTNKLNLDLNIVLNGLSDIVTTYPYGVGDETATKEFYLTNKGNTSSFIFRNDGSIKNLDSITVKTVRLDDFFDEETKIDYFRMDVEGYELNIIKGMERILKSALSPAGCFIEVHSELLKKIGSSAEEFIDIMVSYGYQIKVARFRGKLEKEVFSTDELKSHELFEQGYWEAFFIKR